MPSLSNYVTLGTVVAGATASRVLFAGAGGVLDEDAGLTYDGTTLSAPGFAGDGSALTGLDASALATGTVPSARLPDLSGTYSPAGHSHAIADVADLQSTLAAKADTPGVHTQSLTGDLTLTPSSPTYQILHPNGAGRTVTLPASPPSGLAFAIKNAASGGPDTITVRDAAASQVGQPIPWGVSLSVVYSGSAWEVL